MLSWFFSVFSLTFTLVLSAVGSSLSVCRWRVARSIFGCCVFQLCLLCAVYCSFRFVYKHHLCERVFNIKLIQSFYISGCIKDRLTFITKSKLVQVPEWDAWLWHWTLQWTVFPIHNQFNAYNKYTASSCRNPQQRQPTRKSEKQKDRLTLHRMRFKHQRQLSSTVLTKMYKWNAKSSTRLVTNAHTHTQIDEKKIYNQLRHRIVVVKAVMWCQRAKTE